MPRVQYQFKRDERLRFLSHLDQQRLFARAFRRAGFDVLYSQGFNPHPKMSFALAMSVGLTSDCEYGEVVIGTEIELADFVENLNAVLPAGLEVVRACICNEQQKSLSANLKKSSYDVQIKLNSEIGKRELEESILHFLDQAHIEIEKRNKRGKKVVQDIKPYIESIIVGQIADEKASLEINVRYDDQKTVKPDLILTSFNDHEMKAFLIDSTLRIHRKDLILKDNCFDF
ncbi:TIGR03936 family radical SAM-associated protein [Eubacteriaceae bacterium ES2]|nr:TIGR03936 family radical SAM-associated protein [Eubacteriaceae bacterium ES2]